MVLVSRLGSAAWILTGRDDGRTNDGSKHSWGWLQECTMDLMQSVECLSALVDFNASARHEVPRAPTTFHGAGTTTVRFTSRSSTISIRDAVASVPRASQPCPILNGCGPDRLGSDGTLYPNRRTLTNKYTVLGRGH